MNSRKFHDTKCKSQLCFYTVTLIYQKRKSREQSIYINIKRNKILKNKLNQGGERLVHPKLQNSNE